MTPEKFVESLEPLRDVTAQWKVLESWLQKGERDKLIEVARLCAITQPHEWQKRSMSERTVEMLALEPGRENLEALLQIARFSPLKLPYLAEILTQNQNWKALLHWFDSAESRLQNHEFLAFLSQEIVLRGPDLTQTAARFIRKDLVASQHELGVLPLFRLPCEAGFPQWRRRYGRGASSWSWTPQPGTRKVLVNDAGEIANVEETECDAVRLGSAVANWCDESNGLVEARCFEFSRSLDAKNFGLKTLAGLELESLHDGNNLVLQRVDFTVALETIFAVACNGGAYNHGEYGARGRLKAWQSVAEMCNCSASDPETIHEVAQNCTWFEFSASSAWFYQIAWDLGMACLREDGKTVAVLCATDTD